jgi:acetyl-CoA carboxylase biotin carboxyl carrier protein
MPEKRSGPTEPLDVRRIHYLVRLMKRYDLTALDVNEGSVHIRLRRRGPETASAFAAALPPAASGPVYAPPVMPHAPARTEPPPPAAAAKTILIESPMVGTYYSASAPDAPPFVTAGSIVNPETIVCIIEAMKVFTDIPAGVSGSIAEVLVKSGQAVEFGQPLFRVIPA